MELWNARRHSLRSCPARSLIESTAAERYPLCGTTKQLSDSTSSSPLRCPGLACGGTMVPEVRNGVVADRCERCRGVWFDGAELDRWLRDTPTQDAEAIEATIPHRGTPSRQCPRCAAWTVTAGWNDLVLDRCPECRGLFVEVPELDWLLREAPPESMPFELRLRDAMVSAGWALLAARGVALVLLRFLR